MAPEPTYTVFIRVAGPRGDFVDPPPVSAFVSVLFGKPAVANQYHQSQVSWNDAKDDALWKTIHPTGSATQDIDCKCTTGPLPVCVCASIILTNADLQVRERAVSHVAPLWVGCRLTSCLPIGRPDSRLPSTSFLSRSPISPNAMPNMSRPRFARPNRLLETQHRLLPLVRSRPQPWQGRHQAKAYQPMAEPRRNFHFGKNLQPQQKTPLQILPNWVQAQAVI